MNETLNHPLYEAVAEAEALVERGAEVFQKFTCAGCGQRLAMSEPNTFYKTGECDQCDAITDIEKDGCNYMAVFTRKKPRCVVCLDAGCEFCPAVSTEGGE